MGKEIFFTLCVLDIPLRFQARCRSALFVPNRRLGNKVHRETRTPHLFRHNEFLEIQESVLVKEADVLKGRRAEKESAVPAQHFGFSVVGCEAAGDGSGADRSTQAG